MKIELSDLANEAYRTISPVREIMSFAEPQKLKKLGIQEKDLISFGGGWVNHKSPIELREAYLDIINDPNKFHLSGGYSATNGDLFCKEAIVKYEKEFFRINGISPENILIGHSSTHITSLLFKAFLNKKDRICLLDPAYCNYPMQIYHATASPILRFRVLDKTKFEYIGNEKETIKEFQDFLLLNKPKLVLLTSPDNPTGQIPSDEFINTAYECVLSYGGAIVIDFAYKEIVFGEYPEYFSWKPNDNFISIHSNSKWCRGLGRRLGWLEATNNIVDAFESLQNATILSPDRMHQMAFAEYINRTIGNGKFEKYIHEMRELYKSAAIFTVAAIEKYLKKPYLKPQGGLYTCIQVNENAASFVERVLNNTGVLLIPGWGFGNSLNKSVRLSYGPLVYDHNLIEEGLKKVSAYINENTHNEKN